LPGITALALTLGMAVDANVLIFERVREELRDGCKTEIALELGHKRAFLTILDSNITTLLTAVLLVFFGVGSVKGFGITLAVGVLTTLFTVLCFNRALLELLAQRGKFKLSSRAWLGEANFDFLSRQKTAATVSVVLFLIGCVALGIRGKSVLSIDFVGGEELLARRSNDGSSKGASNGTRAAVG
jgi:SecD/SecF fusion protein